VSPVSDAPDLSAYHQIHRAMRESAARLHVAAVSFDRGDRRRAAALARWFRGFAGELRYHHVVEDEIFFPALAARVPTYVQHDAGLAADHQRLDVLLDDLSEHLQRLATDGDWFLTSARVASLAAELRHHLDEHLGVEDEDVLPLFERHFTAAEYADMERRAMRRGSLPQLAFTVPWLCSMLDPVERDDLLAAAPRPFRVLWWATRGRYARHAAPALGPDPEASVA
jgi:hemerythrin-like domain-containing protein